MVNFNTKKRILRKLSDTAEKHVLLLLPCLIVAGFVKLYYFILCNIDIAFSDKDGNFLGIKQKEKPPKAEKRRKDDIVYVKRPFLSRMISAVLAFAFVGMFVPEALPVIEAFAETPSYVSTSDSNGKFYDCDAVHYGDSLGKYDYYYNNGTLRFDSMEIDEAKCEDTYGAFKIAVKSGYNLNGATKLSNDNGEAKVSDNGKFVSAEIRGYGMDDSGSTVVRETGYTLYTSSKRAVTNPSQLAEVTECAVSGLNPAYKYNFYIVIREAVVLYQIEKGGNIADYIDDDTGEIITKITSTTPEGKKAATLQRVTVELKSNVVSSDPGQWLDEPNPNVEDDIFTVEYSTDGGKIGNKITVSYDLVTANANKSDDQKVTGYKIWKRTENGTYSVIGTRAVNSWGSGDWVYTDENVEDTTKYYYVLTSYANTFPLQDNTNTVKTSHEPSGNLSNNYDEYVYTKTAKPQNLTVTSNNTYNTITWTAVPGATSYRISRVNDAGVEEALGAQTSTTYKDTTIDSMSSYTYKVVAINGNNDENHVGNGARESDAAEQWIEAITPSVDEPFNVQAISSDNDTVIYITWQCYTQDVTGFDIIIEKVLYDENGEEIGTEPYDTVESVKASSAFVRNETDTNGKAYSCYSTSYTGCIYGESYRVSVQSYLIVGNTGKKDPISDPHPRPLGYFVKIGTDIYPPQEVYATSASKQITVNWSASQGASDYVLNIYKIKNGKVVNTSSRNVGNVTSYTLSGLADGDIYGFTVQAEKDVLGKKMISSKSEEVIGIVGNPLTRPVDLTVAQNGDNVDISWKAVDGADGYYLYIKNMTTGVTDTKDRTAASYTQTDAVYGTTYQYYVVAYKTITFENGESPLYYQSQKSDVESLTVGGKIGFPSNLKATPSDGQIDLSWDAVAGAEGYIIYATCDGKTETFNVTGNSFSHTGLTAGKTYSYYVTAYKTVSGSTVSSVPSVTVKATVGGVIAAPTDFEVSTTESTAVLKWTAVSGAEGYTVYGKSDDGQTLEIDVSKATYTHTGLISGETWTYYVKAYKTISNERVYSSATNSIAVKIGSTLAAPTDLVATAGNRQVDLKWTAVTGAAGYIVYVYDNNTANFQPVTIVSQTSYSHTSLVNGQKYTYMVAAYKINDGDRIIGNYSLSVSAIPTAGNAADVDTTIAIKGTAPYGISHSELISAAANHDAFDDPVDAYISVNDESTSAVKEVLRGYANGLKSFIVYPFDITLYLENSLVEVEPNDGFNVTFTIPVPDQMADYRDYITVIHLKDDGTDEVTEESDYSAIFVSGTDLEVLPSAIVDVGGVWCVQFTTSSCSPFAFVVYKDNLSDVSSGGASSADSGFAGSYDTSILLFTALPDILPAEKKTKFVVTAKKRYRIKSRTLK
jgi:hypothetical protein